MLEGVSTFSLLLAIIILLVFLILLTVLAIFIYSGLFNGIDDVGTGKPPIGQIIIAYKFQRGPYNEAGQLFTEAAIIAPANKAIGIYYDDPNKVDSHHLRYVVGSILAEGDTPVDEDMVKEFTKNEFKILHLPEVTYAVQTKFPYITALSIVIAARKAYPMMQAYVEEHKLCAHPYMEYYDSDTIHYMAPLSKQDEFYVPECTAGVLGGCWDETTGEWDSSSNLSTSQTQEEDTRASLDITQTSVDSNTNLDAGDGDDNEKIDGDNDDDDDGDESSHVGPEEKGEVKVEDQLEGEKQNDDDQASDDSSSSFELVKKDPVV